MTSAAKRTSKLSRPGFSLLEIIIVLALTMMVIGGAVGAMYLNRDEAILNDAVQEVEVLAKRARTIATLQQTPYALEITVNGVALMPFAEATLEQQDRESMIEAMESGEVETDSEGEIERPVQSGAQLP